MIMIKENNLKLYKAIDSVLVTFKMNRKKNTIKILLMFTLLCSGITKKKKKNQK